MNLLLVCFGAAYAAMVVASAARGAESPALAPVPVRPADDPHYADDQRQFQGIPSIAITPGGRLWATWYSGGAGEGPDNYVLLATSADRGRTWSKPVQVIDPPSPVRGYDAVVWCDPLGRLWWFHAQTYGSWDGRAGVWARVSTNADDSLPTWSEPRRIADGIMKVDGKPIYEALDMKVGLFQAAMPQANAT